MVHRPSALRTFTNTRTKLPAYAPTMIRHFCNLTIMISGPKMEIFPILSYRGSCIGCAGVPRFVSMPTNRQLQGLHPPIESTNSQDRKTAKLNFTLKNEHLAKLANRSCVRYLPLLFTARQLLPQTTLPTPPLLHVVAILHPDWDLVPRGRLPNRVPADVRGASQQSVPSDQLPWDQEETWYCPAR